MKPPSFLRSLRCLAAVLALCASGLWVWADQATCNVPANPAQSCDTEPLSENIPGQINEYQLSLILNALTTSETDEARAMIGYDCGILWETGKLPEKSSIGFNQQINNPDGTIKRWSEQTSVRPDIEIAVYCYDIAAQAGNAQAKQKLAQLEKQGSDIAALKEKGRAKVEAFLQKTKNKAKTDAEIKKQLIRK